MNNLLNKMRNSGFFEDTDRVYVKNEEDIKELLHKEGFIWYDSYDSKKEDGYIGIWNDGDLTWVRRLYDTKEVHKQQIFDLLKNEKMTEENKIVKVYWATEKDKQVLKDMFNYYGISSHGNYGNVLDRTKMTVAGHVCTDGGLEGGVYLSTEQVKEGLEKLGYKHVSEFCLKDFAPIGPQTKKKIGEIEYEIVDGGLKANGKFFSQDFLETMFKLAEEENVVFKVGCQTIDIKMIKKWWDEVKNYEKERQD